MITIVGVAQEAILKATCRHCASMLEYTRSDIQERTDTDYTGSKDIVKFIPCPKCGHQVVVRGY